MRPPAFWNRPKPTLAARLLTPLAAIYGAVAASRMKRPGAHAGVRVVCVGNFTMGGTGKTPAALAIAKSLIEQGERVVFLSRGYGGSLSGRRPVRVDPAAHAASEVGDEPLLLARLAPTIICADRVEGALAARRLGASVVVMDDGLQNPALAKDERIAVVDGPVGLGDGLVFPAGPLRAPMDTQWAHVDRVLIVAAGEAGARVAREAKARGKHVEFGRLVPDEACVAALRGRRLMAFAGIGRPDKFFATLEEAGLSLAARQAFPDHHAFSRADIEALVKRGEREGLRLVTTEKDMVRLAPDLRARAMEAGVAVLPVRLAIEAG